VWSAEERAEGLEYMHPKPSSHSGRILGNPEVGQKRGSGKVRFRRPDSLGRITRLPDKCLQNVLYGSRLFLGRPAGMAHAADSKSADRKVVTFDSFLRHQVQLSCSVVLDL